MNNSNIVILMYDITNQQSFQQIDELLNQIKENFEDKKFLICLIGNKIDLKSKRVVIEENALIYCKNNNINLFKEICSIQGDNIKNLLEDIVKSLYKPIKNEENGYLKFSYNESLFNSIKSMHSIFSNIQKNEYIDNEYKEEINNINKKKCCKCQCCKCCCCIIF